jgi:hypothetical protein
VPQHLIAPEKTAQQSTFFAAVTLHPIGKNLTVNTFFTMNSRQTQQFSGDFALEPRW